MQFNDMVKFTKKELVATNDWKRKETHHKKTVHSVVTSAYRQLLYFSFSR
jgi:hypothetical protein